MKKLLKKIKKLNNNGSSIIMVVVSMAFIGIIVGALLTAAGYAYKLRMQDLNARDNFYYVERAMDEIYAGVGSVTVSNMQEAYIYTVENMTRYNIETQTYENISNDAAEEMFKTRFMQNLSTNPYFANADIADSLRSYITDPDVTLDDSRLRVERILMKDAEGNVVTDQNGQDVLEKIIIKNVVLNRTVDYKKSVANGHYTQTISADIEIGNPDFDVLFNGTSAGNPNILSFAMVADMGIEIETAQPVTIAGNLYAASDFYNKKYNESTYNSTVQDSDKTFSSNDITYKHGSVTSKVYSENDADNTYINQVASINEGKKVKFDGVDMRSMYSGLYIDKTDVSILADIVIVPGTIAVMDTGKLSIYGKNGLATDEAEVWADNMVLGGYTSKVPVTDNAGNAVFENNEQKYSYTGSEATIRADIYMKDDTEVNAKASELAIRGRYYGYSDSTQKDKRVFVPTVDADNFLSGDTDENGNTVIRDHYNSSAIIVNGENSTLNLAQTNVIYLAGRSYIELSKKVTSEDFKDEDENQFVNSQTVEYIQKSDDLNSDDPNDTVFLRDYKTGESLSVKSNQLAYIPAITNGMPVAAKDSAGKFLGYWTAQLPPLLDDVGFFGDFFPKSVFDNKIPCIMQEVSGKKYYYYDFETIYDKMVDAGKMDTTKYPSAQAYAAGFIQAYVEELNKPEGESNIAAGLTDITSYAGFDAGDITLPVSTAPDTHIYSSGAITSKTGTEFKVELNNDASLSALFTSQDFSITSSSLPSDYARQLSNEYNYVKWNLGHMNETVNEKAYIDNLVASDSFGEAAITPINKFMNFDKLPANEKKLDLASEYYVVYSQKDINVDETGVVKGIIITKGDVTFGEDVTGFEGLIVAGGKVYIRGQMNAITSSAEICRSIIRECQLSGDDKCADFLKLFKDYEDSTVVPADDSTEVKSIDTIDYSDVVKFDNWMKNVE